jgi:hypothetical protein
VEPLCFHLVIEGVEMIFDAREVVELLGFTAQAEHILKTVCLFFEAESSSGIQISLLLISWFSSCALLTSLLFALLTSCCLHF